MPTTPTLTLQSVAYYTSSGAPTFFATISKVDSSGKTWNIVCKIPQVDSDAIWGTVMQYWGGGDDQTTLQKLIDLSV